MILFASIFLFNVNADDLLYRNIVSQLDKRLTSKEITKLMSSIDNRMLNQLNESLPIDYDSIVLMYMLKKKSESLLEEHKNTIDRSFYTFFDLAYASTPKELKNKDIIKFFRLKYGTDKIDEINELVFLQLAVHNLVSLLNTNNFSMFYQAFTEWRKTKKYSLVLSSTIEHYILSKNINIERGLNCFNEYGSFYEKINILLNKEKNISSDFICKILSQEDIKDTLKKVFKSEAPLSYANFIKMSFSDDNMLMFILFSACVYTSCNDDIIYNKIENKYNTTKNKTLKNFLVVYLKTSGHIIPFAITQSSEDYDIQDKLNKRIAALKNVSFTPLKRIEVNQRGVMMNK
jgi:hypothetical protein